MNKLLTKLFGGGSELQCEGGEHNKALHGGMLADEDCVATELRARRHYLFI